MAELSIERMKEIIGNVMGNPVRSSEYGLAGERKPSPYAAVDDNTRQVHMHVYGTDEADAVSNLFFAVARHYPLAINREVAP